MKSEFLAIQLEFSLVKQCDMYVIGDSNFGELIRSHIAAGYPYQARGSLPHRFIYPPGIRIAQGIDIYMKGYKKTHEQLMNTPVKAIQAFLLDSDKKEIMIDAQTNDTRMKEFVQSSIRMYCQYAKILSIKKDFCVT